MNRVCSNFAQLLQLFPRTSFQQAVLQHKAERNARGFRSWGQFVAMLFVSWPGCNRCARYRQAWRPVKANCGT